MFGEKDNKRLLADSHVLDETYLMCMNDERKLYQMNKKDDMNEMKKKEMRATKSFRKKKY